MALDQIALYLDLLPISNHYVYHHSLLLLAWTLVALVMASSFNFNWGRLVALATLMLMASTLMGTFNLNKGGFEGFDASGFDADGGHLQFQWGWLWWLQCMWASLVIW